MAVFPIKLTAAICVLCSLQNIFPVHALEGIDFDYNHPEDWPNIVPECGGQKQSPINVDERNATMGHFPPLIITGVHTIPKKMTFGQKDNDVQLRFEYDENPFLIKGGPLIGEYKLFLIIFYWGPTNGIGSQHAINGKTGSMGIVFYAYNTEYGNSTAASKKPKGLVGFGKVIDIDDDESKFNVGLMRLFPKLDELQDPNAVIDIEPFPLANFMSGHDQDTNTITFLTYDGSMLQPPCRENMPWFIDMEETARVPQKYLDALRKIKKQEYRPLQPQNGRKIYKIVATAV